MIESYSVLQAWFHENLIADRAIHAHHYLLEQGNLSSILAQNQPRHVLDVGCGGGQTVMMLKERYPHLWLTGIDLSQAMIGWAQSRAKRKQSPVSFEVANAQELPFPDETFDVVYSFGSVKHWHNPHQGIAECWRVLKTGGELLLADSTSDATMEQVVGFYELARMPALLKKPLTRLFYRYIVRPARPMELYQQIATDLGMPSGTVSLLAKMPAFIYRTQKPA